MEITEISGVECAGIREKYGLGIVRCRGFVAGVFTKNRIKSASVIVCKDHIADGRIEGLIVNSGNANAFTGEKGIENARKMCRILASLMKCDEREIAIASTGIIGRQLDMDWIEKRIPEVYSRLGKTKRHAEDFAKAIITTDRFPKKAYSKYPRISAVAKGAGMISPNMATMLCFIFTDAKFDSGELYEMLKEAVDLSFNRLIVDGDMSTNDTVLLISTARERVNRDDFQNALNGVCLNVAKQIAMDGEGATKLVEVFVEGAKNNCDALRIARAIASSLLVKTAIFGNDPNWGRIVAAMGYSGADVDEKVDIIFEGVSKVKLVEDGVPTGREEYAREILRKSDEIKIKVKLNKGSGKGYAIGCDLSYDYVKLNSEYTT